jgi:pyruvate,water dikinase
MQNEIVWTSGFFNERFPAPISPLGWSLIGPLIEELALRDPLRFLGYPDAATIPLTRLWHGHPYANALAFQIIYKCFPDSVLPEDAYRYFPAGNTRLRQHAPYPRWIDAPRLVFALFRAFLSDPFNVSPLSNYAHWARYTRAHDRRVATLRAQYDELAQAAPRALFAALRDAARAHRDLLRIHRWSLMDADLTFGLLKRLARAWIDRARANEIAARLVAGAPNKTLEVDAALRAMTSDKWQMTNTAMQAFLAEHGHRSFSLDIATPTFAEEPAQIARVLQTTDNRRQTIEENSSLIRHPSSFPQRVIFAWVRLLARKYVALREDQRYYWQKSLAVSRHLYLLLADRLVAAGVIAERNAVFYATHPELLDYFDARMSPHAFAQSIAARQAEWRAYTREFEQAPTITYPQFLRGDTPLTAAQSHAEIPEPSQGLQTWRGRAVSPGIARGVARVAQSAAELARVQPGEILIAPATDPAWTPVFARIAGLVVERGGVLSHSAVVAREYRVPAVAGIPNIVAEIHDGEMIEVDGNSAIVRIVQ